MRLGDGNWHIFCDEEMGDVSSWTQSIVMLVVNQLMHLNLLPLHAEPSYVVKSVSVREYGTSSL